MANARALDKRRKSVRNIKKITRTMELIATARFKKAMDRAMASTEYTRRITQVVTDLANSGTEVKHPLLEGRDSTENAALVVLSANRGLCGGYNGNVVRTGQQRLDELKDTYANVKLVVSGKRGLANFKFRGIEVHEGYLHFEDKPAFDEVEPIANEFLADFISGKLDRLDVAYTKFISSSKQQAVVETLLPLGSLVMKKMIQKTQAARITIMNSCHLQKAFWKRLFRQASELSYSSVFSMGQSANRLHAWLR